MGYNTGGAEPARFFSPEEAQGQRAEKLKEFQDAIVVLQTQIAEYQKVHDDAKVSADKATADLTDLQNQVTTSQQMLIDNRKKLEDRINAVENQASQILSDADKQKTEVLADLDTRKKSLDVQELEIKARENAAEQKGKDLEAAVAALDPKIADADQKMKAALAKEKEIAIDQSQIDAQNADLVIQKESIASTQELLSGDISKHEQNVAQFKSDLSILAAAQLDLSSREAALKVSQEALIDQQKDIDTQNANLTISKQALDDQAADLKNQKLGLDMRNQNISQREQALRDAVNAAKPA